MEEKIVGTKNFYFHPRVHFLFFIYLEDRSVLFLPFPKSRASALASSRLFFFGGAPFESFGSSDIRLSGGRVRSSKFSQQALGPLLANEDGKWTLWWLWRCSVLQGHHLQKLGCCTFRSRFKLEAAINPAASTHPTFMASFFISRLILPVVFSNS